LLNSHNRYGIIKLRISVSFKYNEKYKVSIIINHNHFFFLNNSLIQIKKNKSVFKFMNEVNHMAGVKKFIKFI